MTNRRRFLRGLITVAIAPFLPKMVEGEQVVTKVDRNAKTVDLDWIQPCDLYGIPYFQTPPKFENLSLRNHPFQGKGMATCTGLCVVCDEPVMSHKMVKLNQSWTLYGDRQYATFNSSTGRWEAV